MKLVFATHNQNKFKEVQLLMPSSIELLSLNDIGCTEVIPETSETIEGNAIQKAMYVLENYGYHCFADDTGLEVAALEGAPGVYSARYAGPARDADDNIDKLLKNLSDKDHRAARFKTAIALTTAANTVSFIGICEGSITEARSGNDGFGYDPIFLPTGSKQTFAEMTLQEKSDIGHRGKAMRQLLTYLSKA